MEKGLVVGILVLLSVSSIPSMGSEPIEKQTIRQTLTEEPHYLQVSDSREINITFNGTMGNNGWFISSVKIVIIPNEINHTYYSFDNQTWIEYTAPIIVSADGYFTLYVLADKVYGPYLFKVDKTPATIDLYAKKIGYDKYRIHADAYDATSGVNRVEFYLNYYLIFNDSTLPYEWNYSGPSFILDGIVYDNAGNSYMALVPHGRSNFLAIGWISDPHMNGSNGTFFAKYVVFIAYGFLNFHISTLVNQLFALYNYKGLINEHFICVKYTTER
jgi:hypothetical protein